MLGLAAFPAGVSGPFGAIGKVAATAATVISLLATFFVFVRTLLAATDVPAALLAALHVVVLVALLPSTFMLLAASTLIGHFLFLLVEPPA